MTTKTWISALTLAALLTFCFVPHGPRLASAQQPPAMTMTITLVPQVDVFQAAARTYTLTKTPAPNTRAQVYVNGVLMCEPCGTDYTLAGTALTFTGQRTSEMQNPVVQVWYWVRQ